MPSRERLDWGKANVIAEFAGGFRLVVSGETPVPMEVKLEPEPPGVAEWEYWPIELVGDRPENAAEVITPFDVSIELTGTVGSEGVELIGATMNEKFPVQS
jgi:hypothetical protein